MERQKAFMSITEEKTEFSILIKKEILYLDKNSFTLEMA